MSAGSFIGDIPITAGLIDGSVSLNDLINNAVAPDGTTGLKGVQEVVISATANDIWVRWGTNPDASHHHLCRETGEFRVNHSLPQVRIQGAVAGATGLISCFSQTIVGS